MAATERVRLLALGVALLPVMGAAGVCADVEALESFADKHREKNHYFKDYYLRSRKGVYFILATKKLRLDFTRAGEVMGNLDRYAEFMPGYKRIRVTRADDGSIYTAIRFQPDFSFFESRFTNQVELLQSETGYRQCWRQLDAKDPRVVEKHRRAPVVNRGYWRITPGEDGYIELRYFSSIQPPIPIPGFIYRHVAESSYQEVFERLVAQIRAEGG